MNTQGHSIQLRTALLVGALLVAPLVTSTTASAQQPRGEQLTANLVDPSGYFGRFRSNAAPVVIHLDHYTSDAEAGQLKDILAQKGPNALRDALWDQEAGYIRVGGGLGYPIAAARSHPTDDGGRIIRLMIDRPISQREVFRSAHTLTYPFGYIEIKLDAKGNGSGDFYRAAKVTLTGDTLHIDNFSPQPFKLLAVKAKQS
ncbi:MAG TPA: hypothetical protein VIE43_16100 [Thermoanaerobaculia bacterium]|nr:hypothetical protein [Thermoanaerobaculia bacterium]